MQNCSSVSGSIKIIGNDCVNGRRQDETNASKSKKESSTIEMVANGRRLSGPSGSNCKTGRRMIEMWDKSIGTKPKITEEDTSCGKMDRSKYINTDRNC